MDRAEKASTLNPFGVVPLASVTEGSVGPEDEPQLNQPATTDQAPAMAAPVEPLGSMTGNGPGASPLVHAPSGTDFRIVRNCTRVVDGGFVFDQALAQAMGMTPEGVHCFGLIESEVRRKGPLGPDLVGVDFPTVSPEDLVLGKVVKWKSWRDRFGVIYGYELQSFWWGSRIYLNKALSRLVAARLLQGAAVAGIASLFAGPYGLAVRVAAAVVAAGAATMNAVESCNGVYIQFSTFFGNKITDGKDG